VLIHAARGEWSRNGQKGLHPHSLFLKRKDYSGEKDIVEGKSYSEGNKGRRIRQDRKIGQHLMDGSKQRRRIKDHEKKQY